MPKVSFLIYLLSMAGVTYLIRMVPLVLVKRKIKNRFVLSFLYYIPYAVLSVMTVPAIFSATENPVSGALGFVAALIGAFFERSLVFVAATACSAVFITEFIFSLL